MHRWWVGGLGDNLGGVNIWGPKGKKNRENTPQAAPILEQFKYIRKQHQNMLHGTTGKRRNDGAAHLAGPFHDWSAGPLLPPPPPPLGELGRQAENPITKHRLPTTAGKTSAQQ